MVIEAVHIDFFCGYFANILFLYKSHEAKKEEEDAMGRENEEYTARPPACRVTREPCGMLYFDIFINMSYY